MARRAAPPPASPARPQPLQRIADMIGRAVPPDRVRREAEAMVAALLAGAGDRIEVGEQLGAMAQQLAEGVEAAREAAADLDRADEAGQRQADAAIASLMAARDVLAAAAAP